MSEINIVIPVYNEADSIRDALTKIEQDVFIPCSVNIIYDSEQDATLPIVRDIQRNYKTAITLVKNKYGRGALNAIRTGLEMFHGKYTVVTTADLSDRAGDINRMYKIAEEEKADIVCGSRYMKEGKQIGGPIIKSCMSRLAGLTLYYLARVPTRDATNNFKLYRNDFLKEQIIESTGGFELGLELVAKAHANGYKIRETPTIWTDRVTGVSHFKTLAWMPQYLKWYFYAFKGLRSCIIPRKAVTP